MSTAVGELEADLAISRQLVIDGQRAFNEALALVQGERDRLKVERDRQKVLIDDWADDFVKLEALLKTGHKGKPNGVVEGVRELKKERDTLAAALGAAVIFVKRQSFGRHSQDRDDALAWLEEHGELCKALEGRS
jgi:hypothetical protein